MSDKKREIKVIATNKKAYFQYEIVDKYKAGIVLTGTEVKSVRGGRVSMSDSYCVFIRGELWLRSMHIAEYQEGGLNNHVPKHERKILLNKRELRKLEVKTKERGFTIIPVQVFLNEKNLVKVVIALVRGKKLFSKKNTIKERDIKRDMARSVRDYR
ncbi:MAG: SsrA-binding protein SmpB [Chitinophagales bacterium]